MVKMLPSKVNFVLKTYRISPLHAVLYGCMLVLLAFSLYYYKLRIFSDTAGCLTDIVRNDGFTMGHNRFICFINQLLPAAFVRAHAWMKAIVMAYSFNHMLVPVGLALLCMHWLKRPYHALALLLQVVLMNVLLFYYAISELQMGLFLLLFYDAVADHALETGRWKTFGILSLLIPPVLAFSHPMILAFTGWLCYRLLKDKSDYRNTAIAAACFFAGFLIKKTRFTSFYEMERGLTWEKVRPFGLNYLDGPFAHSVYEYILKETFMVPLVLLCSIILLARLRKYTLIGLMLVLVVGIFTLIVINFENWESHYYDQYYEHMIQPAVFFIVLGFSYGLLRFPGRVWLKAGAVAIIFIISLAKISSGSEQHVARQRWMYGYLELMDKLQLKKAVVGRIWIPEGMVRGSFWSSSWESLILSSLEGPEHSKTLFMVWDTDTARIHEPIEATDEFVTDGWSFKQNTLPTPYFQLGSKPYVILEQVVPDTVLEHLRWK